MSQAAAIPTEGRLFAIALSTFYAAVFAINGGYMPFFPVWLQSVGLEPSVIGLVMAAPTAARLIAVPVVTAWVGKHDVLRGAIIVTAALTFAGLLALGSVRSALAIALLLWLTSLAWTPLIPLADAYALRGGAHYRRSYGPIRLWGSVGYIGGALVAGLFTHWLGAVHAIWIIAALAFVCALSSFRLTPPGQAKGGTLQVAKPSALLRNTAFASVLIAAALIQGSHSAYYTFSAISWRGTGMDTLTIALLWALCVVVEIVLFAVSPRLRLSPAGLIALGGAGAVLRWLVMAQEPPLAVLACAQALHALSFGATHLGTMGLFARVVPGRMMPNAQGYTATASGIVMASTGIACGALFASLGQAIYYGMAAMALAGTLVMLLAHGAIRAAMRAEA
jgi:PPP family 3-phenylpropionic acid transporter